MTISVQFDALPQAQGQVRTCLSDVTGRLQALDSALKPMFEAWQGSSSAAAHELKRRWDTSSTSLNEIGEVIARNLGSFHDGYRSSEDLNTKRFLGG